MNSKLRTMLENTYGVFQQKFQDSHTAWDKFIEFLAVDHNPLLIKQLNHKFEWLFDDSNLIIKLETTYAPQLLTSDYHDHLGDMYLERLVSNSDVQRRGLFLTPTNVAEMMAGMTIEKTDKPINVLDPAAGTGRLLIAAYKHAPNSRLFGVDIDIRCLRIAMTNFSIHKISGYFLHADSLKQEIDISTENGRQNWQNANKWYSSMEKLKPLEMNRDPRLNKPPQQDFFEK